EEGGDSGGAGGGDGNGAGGAGGGDGDDLGGAGGRDGDTSIHGLEHSDINQRWRILAV
ncbi:hypothetical protein Dimus_036532, partial [Dionaea muscipula]